MFSYISDLLKASQIPNQNNIIMAADEVLLLLNLFDSNWFGQEIAKTNPSHDDDHQLVQEIETTKDDDQSMNNHNHDHDHDHRLSFSLPPSLTVRSLSDHQCLLDSKSSFSSSSSSYLSLSPSSVLAAPKLQTIFSGKEVKEFGHDTEHEKEQEQEQEIVKKEEVVIRKVEELEQAVSQQKIKKKVDKRSSRRKNSKSLSDLEFEELKGFMDLSFVFTEEECKDRKLVSMIPGLQRLCKKCTDGSDQDKENHDDQEDDKKKQKNYEIERRSEQGISRPYLSEAWDVLDLAYQGKKEIKQVVNWKIPTLVNDIDLKDQLRFWAHTVASTVR